MEENIVDWKVFLSLWKHRSISQAALELQLKPSEVSRRIAQLEHHVGYSLFDRSVRPFSPTEDAKAIVVRVRDMLMQREMLMRHFKEKQSSSDIVIRLMMGNSYRRFAPKILSEYTEMVPEQRINIISPIDVDEFLIGKADLLHATGPINGADLIMIPRGLVLFIPVASPEYLKTHPALDCPEDISRHKIFSNYFKNRYSFRNPHFLKHGSMLTNFDYIESIRYSNVEMSMQATLDGLGVALSLPHYLCVDELEKGTLVPVLKGWHRPCTMNYMVSKKDTWKLKPVRTFGTWFAKKQIAYLKDSEKKLESLFGKSFVDNLKH